MIVKTSIKGNGIKCDCCNKRFTDRIMRHYEIGAFKNFTLCTQCERQFYKISGVDTIKKVISADNNIYY